MRTSFHHQPEAQHPNFQLSTSWQANYPIFGSECVAKLWLRPASDGVIEIIDAVGHPRVAR
jgi:hypothetical protein